MLSRQGFSDGAARTDLCFINKAYQMVQLGFICAL